MAHFVTNDAADRTIIDGGVCSQIEERRLKDGSGKHDFVPVGRIIGVHRLGQHEPFGLVDRLAELGDHVLPGPVIHRHGVGEGVRAHIQVRIGLEVLRISNFWGEFGELVMCFCLRVVAHPVDLIEIAGHGRSQILYQIVHGCLVLAREEALGIDFADTFSDGAFDG